MQNVSKNEACWPVSLLARWPDNDPTMLTGFDLHLLGEGTHVKAFEKLGSRVIEHDGVSGVHFAVWAPNARGINVVGDFNNWKGREHPMRMLQQSGYWETFVPGLAKGANYKFEVLGADGHTVLKADPLARYFETPPRTASIVWNSEDYEWSDAAWMAARARKDRWLRKPMSVYEVHLGSWQRSPDGRLHTYREMAEGL